MKNEYVIALFCIGIVSSTAAAQQGTRGTPEALEAVERLLEQVGGRDVWAHARSLHVVERVYHPRLGGPIHVEVWRDLDRPAFHSRLSGSDVNRVSVWDAQTGWQMRDGQVTAMTSDAVATESSGWRQEPYRIYRQLALRDSTIRVNLADTNRLVIADRDGRTLCWFLLDAKGAPMKWGNVFDGRINEHTYGPLIQLGKFRMPAWGTSADASWRFEYVSAEASESPLQLPARPTAGQ